MAASSCPVWSASHAASLSFRLLRFHSRWHAHIWSGPSIPGSDLPTLTLHSAAVSLRPLVCLATRPVLVMHTALWAGRWLARRCPLYYPFNTLAHFEMAMSALSACLSPLSHLPD